MENFEPLASRLVHARACLRVLDLQGLLDAIKKALDPKLSAIMTENAIAILTSHEGATRRILALLTPENLLKK
jgi:3-deoxy-D-manno-octulosonic-acid transferase